MSDPFASGALVGAAIGLVVGVPVAIYVVAGRRRILVAEAEGRGYQVVSVRPHWMHVGSRARFTVTLSRGGERLERTALVDGRQTVTWEPPLA